MEYTPITPFKRAIDAGHLAQLAVDPLPGDSVNKWDALRTLGVIRRDLGLSDRALIVLQALLSFHPETELSTMGKPPVVFPSNASICERLNAMPCSTMRRHIAALVKAGLLIRRDSPNGKRYTGRSSGQVFGFDLTPIVRLHAAHTEMADKVQAAEAAQKRLRTSLSLMRRDLASLVAYGQENHPERNWDALSDLAVLSARALRRKLTMEELEAMRPVLETALMEARTALEIPEPSNVTQTDELSTSDAQNEQHHHNSKKEKKDYRGCVKNVGNEDSKGSLEKPLDGLPQHPSVPLSVVRAACKEFRNFYPDKLDTWHDLVRAADILHPMLGISSGTWNPAKQVMGPEEAAIVLVAMVERATEIVNPGGYLRALCRKHQQGLFSSTGMVMSLLNRARD